MHGIRIWVLFTLARLFGIPIKLRETNLGCSGQVVH